MAVSFNTFIISITGTSGFADNSNLNPATQFDSVISVEGIQSSNDSISNYTKIPSTRLNFSLSATKFGGGGSISEVMENLSQFDISETAYQDSEGNWTIGVGHLIKETEAHLYWATLKAHEVQHLLKRDLKPCERFLTTDLGQPLTQNQFDALMSLCFNIGVDQFAGSEVIRQLNKGNHQKAANAILNWNKPAELINRRQKERKLFLQGA